MFVNNPTMNNQLIFVLECSAESKYLNNIVCLTENTALGSKLRAMTYSWNCQNLALSFPEHKKSALSWYLLSDPIQLMHIHQEPSRNPLLTLLIKIPLIYCSGASVSLCEGILRHTLTIWTSYESFQFTLEEIVLDLQ